MAHGSGSGAPRRVVLTGLACGFVGALVLPAAGCGIRLEDDAPRLPLLPTRTPVPAEAELVALTVDTAALADLAATVAGPVAAALVPVHQRQHTVLRTTLLAAQVPAAALDQSPSPTPTATPDTAGPTPSPGTTATPSATATPGATASDRATLAAAEGAAAANAGAFAGVDPDLRASIAALHAQRYAAATLLAGTSPTVPDAPVRGEHVAQLAAATSAATYFLEVVAARSTGKQRARADTTLEALGRLRTDQLAGGSAPDDTLGHPLPFAVGSAADATRLAREALDTLRAGYGEHLAALVASDGAAGLAAITRWLGSVEVEAHRWGLRLAPFPGLE